MQEGRVQEIEKEIAQQEIHYTLSLSLSRSLSISISLLNARHRLTCSWNSVGSFYAGNAIPYGGHIRPWIVFGACVLILSELSCWIVGSLDRCAHWNCHCLQARRSQEEELQLQLLLALIWRHCHRYKTSFVQVVKGIGIRCAYFAYSPYFSARLPSLSLSLYRLVGSVWCWLWVSPWLSLALSTCVHQHLVSREIHSRLVII